MHLDLLLRVVQERVKMPNRFKTRFLSLFRELFLYHSGSLEFRAKVLAVVIAANSKHDVCEQEILAEIAKQTYRSNADRAQILVNAVNEYVDKIEDNSSTLFNSLINDIEHEVKVTKRYKKKIDITQLNRFVNCSDESDDTIYQQRVIAFLERVKG